MSDSTQQGTYQIPNSCALVVCGGASSRMGTDKSLLQYFDKPQRYHVYEMLLSFCEDVFISCNKDQSLAIEDGYHFIEDNIAFSNIGPMAGLLSAFTRFPGKNMLMIGCDYPFLTVNELQGFYTICKENIPAAFYNDAANLYEPLLGWYPYSAIEELEKWFKTGQYSLQHFLNEREAIKFCPSDPNCIVSINTQEEFMKACDSLKDKS